MEEEVIINFGIVGERHVFSLRVNKSDPVGCITDWLAEETKLDWIPFESKIYKLRAVLEVGSRDPETYVLKGRQSPVAAFIWRGLCSSSVERVCPSFTVGRLLDEALPRGGDDVGANSAASAAPLEPKLAARTRCLGLFQRDGRVQMSTPIRVHFLVRVYGDQLLCLRWIEEKSDPPHPRRLEHWDELNKVFENNTHGTLESWLFQPRSSSWYCALEEVFGSCSSASTSATTTNTISAENWRSRSNGFLTSEACHFPDHEVDALHNQLARLAEVLPANSEGKLRLQQASPRTPPPPPTHLIVPILVSVCGVLEASLNWCRPIDYFGRKIEILGNVHVHGSRLRIHGRADFVIHLERIIVCVTVGARDSGTAVDSESGGSQRFRDAVVENRLACESMAALQRTRTVYGITTNYAHWHFAKHLDTHIEVDAMDLELARDGGGDPYPTRESLAALLGALYGFIVLNGCG